MAVSVVLADSEDPGMPSGCVGRQISHTSKDAQSLFYYLSTATGCNHGEILQLLIKLESELFKEIVSF